MYTNKASVAAIKDSNEDFEFYPTTDEIISIVKQNLKETFPSLVGKTLLDCGSGDGRVLKALAEDEINKGYTKITSENQINLIAIEKSDILVNLLPEYIFPIGRDFHQQNLIAIHADIIFNNPPYSEFSLWMHKIINEAQSRCAYFVIPKRWRDNNSILDLIEKRKAIVHSLGFYNFLEGDRQARCEVEVIRVDFGENIKAYDFKPNFNPLESWIDENFKFENKFKEKVKKTLKEKVSEKIKKNEKRNLPVQGNDYVNILVELYNDETSQLFSSFEKICSIDSDNLEFLGLDLHEIAIMINNKAASIKSKYWKELFTNIDFVKYSLGADIRYKFMNTLNKRTKAEFSTENIRGFLVWILKNKNYYDDLLFDEVINKFVSSCNIDSYKSNKNTFVKGKWEYNNKPKDLEKYKLNTTKRIILNNFFWKNNIISYGKLSQSSNDLINNLLAIAYTRGFDHTKLQTSFNDWIYGETKLFCCVHQGQEKVLFKVKVFKTGSIHFNFDKDFINMINIEIGKRKGWITNPSEAADELGLPIEFCSKSLIDINKDRKNNLVNKIILIEK